MQEYQSSMQEYPRVCKSVQEYARVSKSRHHSVQAYESYHSRLNLCLGLSSSLHHSGECSISGFFASASLA